VIIVLANGVADCLGDPVEMFIDKAKAGFRRICQPAGDFKGKDKVQRAQRRFLAAFPVWAGIFRIVRHPIGNQPIQLSDDIGPVPHGVESAQRDNRQPVKPRRLPNSFNVSDAAAKVLDLSPMRMWIFDGGTSQTVRMPALGRRQADWMM
jgi:hypothetical protein